MEVVKRASIVLLISLLLVLPASFMASAATETFIYYPVYDSSTLVSGTPTALAPYGISFKNASLSMVIRKGVLGIAKATFDNGVANGTITVLTDADKVLSYTDPFITPPVIDAANVNHILAPYGVSIAYNTTTTFSFQIRNTGVWACNSTTFANYLNNQYFTLIDEPVTDPPEEPTTEEPTDTEQKNNTFVVRSSIVMGFTLYIIVSLIGYGIYKCVHLFII